MAALSLDASMILEVMSPLYPAYFLPMASIANVGETAKAVNCVLLAFDLFSGDAYHGYLECNHCKH